MGNRKTDVERADAAEDRVAAFNVARLLEIAEQYTEPKRRPDEFTMTWLAKQKGWSQEKSADALAKMERDGIVTSRVYNGQKLWRMT